MSAIAILFAAGAISMAIMAATMSQANTFGMIAALFIAMIFLGATVLAASALRR